MVRARGLEPPQPFGYQILSLARLPIPPCPQNRHVSATKSLIIARNSFKIKSMTLEPKSKYEFPLASELADSGDSGKVAFRQPLPSIAASATKAPQRGSVLRVCGGCGGPFMVRLSELNRGGGRGQFCSRDCRPVGLSDTATRNRARTIWIERHDGAHPICRICGRKADIHHMDGDPLNNAPSNHDRLCRSHHTSHEDTINPRRRCA